MRSRLALLSLLASVTAACGSTDPAPTSSIAAPTSTPTITTIAPATTAMATTTTTTTAPPTTTTTLPPAAGHTLEVPPAPAPQVDGILDPAEWGASLIDRAADGTALHWLHEGQTLYLGIRHETMGAVNLLLASDEEVRVLHSSAALGSALYRQTPDGSWTLEHDFAWCCRGRSGGPDLDALAADEGWWASIGPAGAAGEVEYAVVLPGSEVRVALSFVEADGSAVVWPNGLDPADQEPLYGIRRTPETFNVDEWVLLTLAAES